MLAGIRHGGWREGELGRDDVFVSGMRQGGMRSVNLLEPLVRRQSTWTEVRFVERTRLGADVRRMRM